MKWQQMSNDRKQCHNELRPQPTNEKGCCTLTPPSDASSPPWERQPNRSGSSQSLGTSVFIPSRSAPVVEKSLTRWNVPMWPHGIVANGHGTVPSVEPLPPPRILRWSAIDPPVTARPWSLSKFESKDSGVFVSIQSCVCLPVCFCFCFCFFLCHLTET